MKKILLATVMLAFLAGCSGPADQDQKSSQKATPREQTAAHNHLMKDFGKMRKTEPMKTWPGGKSREETINEMNKAGKRVNAAIKNLKEGKE